MSTRALRRAAYAPLLALVVLLALGTGTTARAADATLVQWGWWTEANYLNGQDTPGTNQTPDLDDVHVSLGPVVFDDPNSLTSDNPIGAVEVSAVRFKLPAAVPFDVDPGAPVADVKLTPDPAYKPVGSPVILACRSLVGWHPELAGNWNDRVYYQSGCSVGATNDGGATYHFTILASQLTSGQYVDVAIAPTLDPHAAPFKMWFQTPTADDLTLLSLPVSTSDFASIPPPPPETQLAPLTSSGYPTTAFAPSSAPPAPAPQQPVAPAPQPAVPQLATAVARPVVDTAARVVAGVLLLAVILAMMSAAGMDMQRLLTPAGQVAGVGRFKRQRTGTPLPL